MAENVAEAKSTAGIVQFEKKYRKPYCVVVDSLYCSMGRMIALKACQKTGYSYYDSYQLQKLAADIISIADIEKLDELLAEEDFDVEAVGNSEEYRRVAAGYDKAIEAALKKGPALIHDTVAKERIEKMGYTCLNVLVYAENLDDKIVRAKVSPLFADVSDRNEIIRGIERQDLIRRNYHRLQSDTVYGDRRTYDLCLNSDAFGRDFSAQLLAAAMTDE